MRVSQQSVGQEECGGQGEEDREDSRHEEEVGCGDSLIALVDPHVQHIGDGDCDSSEETEANTQHVVTLSLQVLSGVRSLPTTIAGVGSARDGGGVGLGKHEGWLHHQNVPQDWKG